MGTALNGRPAVSAVVGLLLGAEIVHAQEVGAVSGVARDFIAVCRRKISRDYRQVPAADRRKTKGHKLRSKPEYQDKDDNRTGNHQPKGTLLLAGRS